MELLFIQLKLECGVQCIYKKKADDLLFWLHFIILNKLFEKQNVYFVS